MDNQDRYQIIDTVATGEFTTVYRARDVELGREVAIKQIHSEYLADPARLESYWKEAQLLASLDHPYILTIYDIVRDRGWLILELMQGNMAQALQGQPIDLDFLRVTLICTLHGLRVLEENNVVHGDVRPSNFLLDRSNRVKLGDFGIARRLLGEDGSLLKVNTKYMAPEVVSDQFGPVGPQSDLYSLGFSAYELMCGNNFDSLFPGLDMYGGNRQMAWIMWHAAVDRRLPEINRVLEGVPDDLVHVIQRLSEKDPSLRYRSAEDALADLRTKGALPEKGPTTAQMEEAAEQAREAKNKRRLAIGALVMSVLLSVGVLFIPTGGGEPPVTSVKAQPSEGLLQHVDLKRNHFILETSGEEKPARIAINPETDRILLDDTKVELSALQKGDRITIRRFTSGDGQTILEVLASRSLEESQGTIAALRQDEALISLKDSSGTETQVYVPSTVEILLNGQAKLNDRRIRFSDLQVADRVLARHVPDGNRRRITFLSAKREVPLQGFVLAIDTAGKKLTVRLGTETDSPLVTYPIQDGAPITLNGVNSVQGKLLTLSDLKAGDHVDTIHDTHFVKIAAQRHLANSGEIVSLDPAAKTLTVKLDGKSSPITFGLEEDCPIRIGGKDVPVEFSFLRDGDTVRISHDSYDLKDPLAAAIDVTPKSDPRAWAVVIGQQAYDDELLSPLSLTASDAQLVSESLAVEYRVPKDQLLLEIDASRRQLEQTIPSFLNRVPVGSQLIVYYAGHGYVDNNKAALLAPTEFDPQRMDATGVPLKWLVTQMESCQAAEKLLLLDSCHPGTGKYAQWQPSSAEQAATLQPVPSRAASTSVIIVASCSKGQRGLNTPDGKQGRFAQHVADGWRGAADTNADHRVSSDELFDFISAKLAEDSTQKNREQTPQRFLPNATPPRLTDEAKAAVRQLLAYLRRTQIDHEAVQNEYELSEALDPGQPDFRLATGLVLLKHKRTADAAKMFQSAIADHPDAALGHHALAWQELIRKNYSEGLSHLVQLVTALPPTATGEKLDPYSQHILQWCGQLRGFISKVVPASEQPAMSELKKLDAAVQARGEQAKELYIAGYSEVGSRVEALDKQIAEASSDSEKNRLQFERRRFTYYASFDFAVSEAFLRSTLEQ